MASATTSAVLPNRVGVIANSYRVKTAADSPNAHAAASTANDARIISCLWVDRPIWGLKGFLSVRLVLRIGVDRARGPPGTSSLCPIGLFCGFYTLKNGKSA
ncbi:hypothetical protein Pme01_08140 [Planosporangium mesophilum]|uniref:Uncharacterized protein n=1 Tax=Planosporangium mesophilum TaxID=689768 RepID=A0A8J3WYI6_9ACTN|nr:hypothetical protein Pme01_08140 [Planosporangium mesophilum]